MGGKIPVVQCIDMEPDRRRLNPKRPLAWRGCERSYDMSRLWREQWEQATGAPAHFSWYFRMDPQVERVYGSATWVVDRYPEMVEDFRRRGDEIGLHVHFYRWDPERRHWVVDHGNARWVEHCLASSLAAFRRALGRPCESFRGGDAWMSQEAVTQVEASGVRFDLTLEPGQEGYRGLRRWERHSGWIPDLRGIPQRPYLPSRANFKAPDPARREGMWMIPVSRGEAVGLPGLAFRLYRLLIHGVRLERTWITLYLFQEPLLFRQVADRLLASTELPYLVLLSHSQAVLRPYFLRNIKKNLSYLLSRPQAKDFALSTPQEAMASLKIISGVDGIGSRD